MQNCRSWTTSLQLDPRSESTPFHTIFSYLEHHFSRHIEDVVVDKDVCEVRHRKALQPPPPSLLSSEAPARCLLFCEAGHDQRPKFSLHGCPILRMLQFIEGN